MRMTFTIWGLICFFLSGVLPSASLPADYPLYFRYIPYTPPNLHLRINRATSAYYLPGMNAGVTYNFDMVPAVAGTLSLASGPIPVNLAVYRVPSNCSGAKSVTVTVQYNISGSFVTIGSQTRIITVPTSGAVVPTYLFNGITSANTYVLSTGDFIRISVTANTTRLCLVNEYPLGGTDTDASRGVFQTGPIFSMTKTSVVASDPVSGVTNPKAVPGALIRYTLTLQNITTASAGGDNVIITDLIPADTTYAAGSLTLDAVPLTDAVDADAGSFNGTAISVNLGTIAPGVTHTITFEVVVD
jgi:uncharacterized repeat protein (TIGR01451 family)